MTAMILLWLGYVWGASVGTNPLRQRQGIPTAVVIDALVGSGGFDLCPGIENTAATPESFWQAAKWWQQDIESLGDKPLQTRYVTDSDDPDVQLRRR